MVVIVSNTLEQWRANLFCMKANLESSKPCMDHKTNDSNKIDSLLNTFYVILINKIKVLMNILKIYTFNFMDG